MSDDLVQNESSVQEQQVQPRLHNDQEVDKIVQARLARKEAQMQREFEERLKGQSSSVPQFDTQAIIEQTTRAVEAKFRQDFERNRIESESKRAQLESEKQATQFLDHIRNIQVTPEEDELEFFTPDGLERYASLGMMAGDLNFPDTADIMKELARNPKKLRELNLAARDKDKAYVKLQFKKISDSIKQNQHALDTKPRINAPVTPLKSSTSGSSSTGNLSVSDIARLSSMRG